MEYERVQPLMSDSANKTLRLRDRALKGSAWTLAQYLINNVLRLGSNLVLAHLLFPEVFALLAYASIVLQGLQMFSDIGIGPAIVQSPRGNDPDFLNTAWTIQVIRGLILFLFALLIGWPVAWFYDEPQLCWIVPACGLNFITTGLQSTAVHTCSRALMLGRLAVWGIVEAILKAAITIVWATIWPSVWALIGGAFISYTVGLVLTHTILPGIRNWFRWEQDAVRTLMRFGGWVSLSTMFTFISSQADRLILGKLVSMEVVGVYSIALMFSRLPYEISSRLAQVVLFPALADVARHDRKMLKAKFLESRDVILSISQLGLLCVIIGSPWFFKLLYDSRYGDAAFFTPFLAGTIWFAILQASADRALLALGNSRALAVSNCTNLLVTVSGCLLGFMIDGLRGFMLGVGAGNLAGYLVIAWLLSGYGLSIIIQDLRFTGIVAIASFVALGIPFLVSGSETLEMRLMLAIAGIFISTLYAYFHLRNIALYLLRRLLPIR